MRYRVFSLDDELIPIYENIFNLNGIAIILGISEETIQTAINDEGCYHHYYKNENVGIID